MAITQYWIMFQNLVNFLVCTHLPNQTEVSKVANLEPIFKGSNSKHNSFSYDAPRDLQLISIEFTIANLTYIG